MITATALEPNMTTTPFSYLDNQRLTLASGSLLPAAQSLLQLSANTLLLAELAPVATAEQLLQAAEQAYLAGYEQHASTEFELKGLAFAGIGDPLLYLEVLSKVIPAFKRQRHGVPVTLVTYGLVSPGDAEALCQQLLALEVERLEVYLPASNPPAYQQAVTPIQCGFSELCQFIHVASEVGLQVSCFAFAPVKQQSELRTLAKELGAREFIVKTPASV
jgi:hypothetical protein